MLRRLTIRNYILIDSLDINFPGNLVVISGETGAGKSILLGALSLLLGHRADLQVLADDSHNCVIEAEFAHQGEEYILRRVITPQGRSRAFINDEPCTLDEMKAISSRLIDIHSQNGQLLLSDLAYAREVVDHFAALEEDAAACASAFDLWQDARRRLEELRARIEADSREHEFLQFRYDRLQQAGLKVGELESLEAEQKRLAGGQDISEAVAAITSAFDNEESSISSSLKSVSAAMSRIVRYVPEFEALKERLESARIELRDIEQEVEGFGDSLDFSPERIRQVEDRLSDLYELMRREDVQTEAELIACRDQLDSRLEASQDSELSCAELAKEVETLEAEYLKIASKLSAARREAAPRLDAMVCDSLHGLELPSAKFETAITEASAGRMGVDTVRFLFSAQPNTPMQELSKCASGGELSRVMLSLKSLLTGWKGMPTVIFDEIDAGVSGSVAHKMGQRAVEMGRDTQVFVITHLPQVASRGRAHFLVYKTIDADGRAASFIRRIEGEERVREIARMLSGETLTEAALANARVLLEA